MDDRDGRGAGGYDSFLLRIWRHGAPAEGWAGRLERVQDGQSLRFTTPDALLAYLRDVIGFGGHQEAEVGLAAAADGELSTLPTSSQA